jgi:hypothetical protein
MRIVAILCSLTLASALVGCGGSSEPTDQATLNECYKTEFGVVPPPGVVNLQAKQVVVGDAAGSWLRFEANSSIISNLISSHSFDVGERGRFISDSGGGNTPSWWKPEQDSLTSFYINSQWRKGSNYSIAWLAFDNTRKIVYFHHGMSF